MKNIENIRQHVNLTFGSDKTTDVNIPLEIPCHAYALGILHDYCIGDFIGKTVNSFTSDFEFLKILSKELNLMGLKLTDIDYDDIPNLITSKRIIQITRMNTPCRDYHFHLLHADGTFSQKYRYFEPTYSSKLELVRGEYSLGIFSVERVL